MEFTPVSQNGIIPPTQLKTRLSNSKLLINSTSSAYGQTVVLKFLNDAPYYKQSSVTFYSKWTHNGTTSTVTLGTSTFVDTVTAPLVINNLGTGTHQLYAVWPGEDRYAGVDTSANPLDITVAPGVALGGTFTATVTPPSGTVVIGEGAVTITATLSTSTQVPGNILFFIDHQQIGSAPLIKNTATFVTNTIPAGTHDITVTWPGATINGINYSGENLDVNYTVLSGTTITAPLAINITPSHGIYLEGSLSITASILNNLNLPGNIQFYQNGSPILGPQVVNNNSATIYLTNNLSVGTSTFYAVWDGNQADHPRYIPITSNTINWNNYARENPGTITMTVSPNPSAHIAQTVFTAALSTTTLVPGNITFYVDGAPFGSAPLVSNHATLSTGTLAVGNHVVYAYYPGNDTAPKYYSTASSTSTLVVYEGYILDRPLNLSISSIDVVNKPITYTASVTTSTSLSNTVNFNLYENVTTITTTTSTAIITVSIVTTATGAPFLPPHNTRSSYQMQIIDSVPLGYRFQLPTWTTGTWQLEAGDTSLFPLYKAPGFNYYVRGYLIQQGLTSQQVADAENAYNLFASNTASQYTITFSGQESTVTSVTTISTANVFVETLGSTDFNTLTNTAILTATNISSTGTYQVQANWIGGYVPNGNYYQPAFSNTVTMTVTNATILGGTFTLTSNNTTSPVTTATIFTAKLNTSTVINGTTGGSVTLQSIVATTVTNTVTNQFNLQTLGYNYYIAAGSQLGATYNQSQWEILLNDTNQDAWFISNSTYNYQNGSSVVYQGPLYIVRNGQLQNGVYVYSYTNGDVNVSVVSGLNFSVPGVNAVGDGLALNYAFTGQNIDPYSYITQGYWPVTGVTVGGATTSTHYIYGISTTSTFANNTATFTIPANTLGAGTYTFIASWAGTTVSPYYASTTSNTIIQTKT
jgi:hypothetical protein